MSRTYAYKPALAWFAAIGSAWVFVLVALGALTTTIGAGMAFPDWPLSNGSVNPPGWLTEIDKFAEHSHRLSGVVMGLVTIGLAVWLHLREERRWLRQLGWWALGIVIFQGLIGGKRVLLDSIGVPGFDMTLGQMLRLPHGMLAQVYVCVLFAIVAGLSRPWVTDTIGQASRRVRLLGGLCLFLLFLQLAVAVTMRHNYAGMVIPTFPLSTPDGHLLPAYWDYRVVLQMAHRLMAVFIGVAIAVYGHYLWRDKGLHVLVRAASFVLLALVAVQIFLGAKIIWTGRSVTMTTGHVVFGALTLATTFAVVFITQRSMIERPVR
ncbi:cytochrome oxidase assembly protein [Oleiharenicola lentus]|uniref:Cytochrome oxidase assembly protein n=1 Tax=Oleiharenicola lentus TaxID=2508720 RepID=A0A4Q1CA94_9BACT|nr:COX15/CtaA family protein [Oleiharenicola lentus]RXK55810.1 cytochrome oxidase assembly protein [Oleiharenicola lentus]